jgi:nucleoside-diphosphate-sugar epimerase
MLALNNPPDKGVYNTWNQLDTTHSIKEIAEMVGGRIKYVKTPRGEHTGTHYYNPINDKLKNLGFEPTRTMEEEIEYMKSILDIDYIRDLAPEPEIKW